MSTTPARAPQSPPRPPRWPRFRLLAWATLGLLLVALLLDRLFPPPLPDLGSDLATVVTARDGRPLRAFPDREGVWRARREFFTGDYPVSTLVAVKALARPEMRVEIEAVGFI